MVTLKNNTKYSKESELEIGCNFQSREAREQNYSKEYAQQLEKDLVGSYYWSGIFCKDYLFFICNWHPLLGMCLSHPAHPWSKLERVMTFIVSCSLTMVPSAFWVYMLRADPKKKGADVFFILVFVTLPVMILETTLYWIAIGDIFCKGKGCVCQCISKCFRCFKNCYMCCSLSFSLIILGISYACMSWMGAPLRSLLKPFVMSRLQSWLLWFVFSTFMPYFGFVHAWCIEKKLARRNCQLTHRTSPVPSVNL